MYQERCENMKRLISVILLLATLFSISSCVRDVSAYSMLTDFITAYPAEGVIYSPECSEGSEGYIDSSVASRIYVFHGELPRNFAVFLNNHADFGSECGVFFCRDEAERAQVTEMCEERMRLLSGGEHTLLLRSGNIIFYSTLRDRDRAESLWTKILRSHT